MTHGTWVNHWASVLAGSMSCGFVRKDGWDILGNDIANSFAQQPDYATCCSICQATSECAAFVYSPSTNDCWPKTSIGSGGNSNADRITGYNRKYVNSLLGNAVSSARETQQRKLLHRSVLDDLKNIWEKSILWITFV